MLVYLRDGSAQTIVRASTLRSCRSNCPSHPVTVYRHRTSQSHAPGRVATGVPIFKSLVWLDPKKSRHKRNSNPGSSLEADALTIIGQRGDHRGSSRPSLTTDEGERQPLCTVTNQPPERAGGSKSFESLHFVCRSVLVTLVVGAACVIYFVH